MIHSLEVDNVYKRYGNVDVVQGVSFRVRHGACFGILGPNGAGKTTLLGMIEGILPISSGSIRLLGLDVATRIRQIQPRMGVQLQQNNYFQFLTVAQLLKFYQELRQAQDPVHRPQSLDRLLGHLGLAEKLEFKVDELSGGQKQRLSIAIALLGDPDIIFLDEPTSALDPNSRAYTWEFIEQLKQDPGKTIILTTHYMEEAERLCDDIMIMNGGRIIAQGNPADLINGMQDYHSIQFQFAKGQFRLEYVHDLADAGNLHWDDKTDRLRVHTREITQTMRAILHVSDARRIDVLDFDVNRPNLEDVFLSHTGVDRKK